MVKRKAYRDEWLIEKRRADMLEKKLEEAKKGKKTDDKPKEPKTLKAKEPDGKDLDISKDKDEDKDKNKDKEEFKYKCPECEEEFNELDKGCCPECDAELEDDGGEEDE